MKLDISVVSFVLTLAAGVTSSRWWLLGAAAIAVAGIAETSLVPWWRCRRARPQDPA